MDNKKPVQGEALNKYKITHVDGSTHHIEMPDKLINKIAKGEYHPVVFSGDEWLINMDNVLRIQNVTPKAANSEI